MPFLIAILSRPVPDAISWSSSLTHSFLSSASGTRGWPRDKSVSCGRTSRQIVSFSRGARVVR